MMPSIPSPSFQDAGPIPMQTAEASSSSSSVTVMPSPTPIPIPSSSTSPAVPQVLYVNVEDGMYYQGTWPPVSVISKGKRRADPVLEDAPEMETTRKRVLAPRDISDKSLSHNQPRVSYPSCNEVGNDVLSCWPTSDTSIFQDQWTKFIWNANLPEFIGLPGSVDIYLYHADSGQLVNNWTGIPNVQGQINVSANDSFWDYRMSQWKPGEQIPYTYYFVIVKSGTTLTGGEERQSTWTAIQTAFADSVYASSSSVASAASITSIAALSSASMEGPASLSAYTASHTPAITGAAGLQGGPRDNNSFPGWAIALLVILGVLAFASVAGLAFVLIRVYRGRNRSATSMGSNSPMMVEALSPMDTAGSPTVTSPHGHSGGPYSAVGAGLLNKKSVAPSSTVRHSGFGDGASTRSVSDTGPISPQDARIMADAFRTALRKPDFGDRPVEEGESPDTNGENGKTPTGEGPSRHPELMSRELAGEGRDIRSVSSARGVTVRSLDEGEQERSATPGTPGGRRVS